jgi:glycosyltransferase involved in cell wall biosynthesis
MRICLDARGNHFGGVYTYTYSLLRTLPGVDSEFEYLVLFDEHQVNEGRLPVDNIPYRTVPVLSPVKMVWWNNMVLPKVLKEENIDLYHGFKHFGLRYPKGHQCKMIWTLRTASWWLFPELFSMQERLFWTRYYTQGAKRLDRVVCVAHADKKAFVESIGLDPGKVSVTQLASDNRFTKVDDPVVLKQVRQKYKLPEKYIVFVGTIYPFKNIETIIRVFAKAKKSGDLPHHLVIAGGLSPAYGEDYKNSLIQLSKDEGVDDRIHWVGSVFDELPAIYTMADALLFPSCFEAFAKPPLEAMACETPVVSSNAAGLPEVVDDAGLMRAPNDIEGLTKDLLEVLGNDSLRKQLIQRGLERVKYFSWERCARETIRIYRDVLNIPPVAEE